MTRAAPDPRDPPKAQPGSLSAHLDHLFTRIASRIAWLAGRPATFLLALAVIAVWAVTGPLFHYSDTWQLVINTGTTIVTFLMVFLIQNSQNRDAAAMQAKLDELIRALTEARGQFIGIEHLTDAQIEEIRAALEHEAGRDSAENGKPGTVHETVERLLNRY